MRSTWRAGRQGYCYTVRTYRNMWPVADWQHVRVHVQESAGHMDILDDLTQAAVNQAMVESVRDALAGRV